MSAKVPPSCVENVPSDDQSAIEVFALAATRLIIGELVQAKELCAQKMETMTYHTSDDQEIAIHDVLGQFFGQEPMQQLKLKKKITLNIVDCIGASLTHSVLSRSVSPI
jgi:hypothetical protein